MRMTTTVACSLGRFRLRAVDADPDWRSNEEGFLVYLARGSAYLRRFALGSANLADACSLIFATSDGEDVPIGFFAYRTDEDDGDLCACGTYVERFYRRMGLGSSIWTFALERERLSSVYVLTTSAAGAGFARAQERKGRTVTFARPDQIGG